MPEMLGTIIGDLLGVEEDLVIVGRSAEGDDTLALAKQSEADVLITHDRAKPSGAGLERILAAAPISILAISDDGRTADAVGVLRRPIALSGDEASGLAQAVREMADQCSRPITAWGRWRSA